MSARSGSLFEVPLLLDTLRMMPMLTSLAGFVASLGCRWLISLRARFLKNASENA